MAQVGDVIGNYRLLEELANGSFGSVYRGVHTVLTTRVVAVKILHMHLQKGQENESFFHEARILEALQHPHILHMFDVGVQEHIPYIVTVYAPGGSLRHHLNRRAGKPLPTNEALSILQQIAQALDYAHQQNIIHRDLKPENILFDAQGTILLADFGISTILGPLSFQQTSPYGTPVYMSPEQFRGEVSRESDQYSLGCIAYELLTGKVPFIAPDVIELALKHLKEQVIPPQQLNQSLPEYLNQAILRSLSKERKQRFADVLAFMAALQTPPKTHKKWLKEGNTLWSLKRFDEALAAYEQALRLDPNLAFAYNGKGNTLRDLKRFDEALAAYEQALRLDPDLANACYGKGNVLADLKRFDEALVAYEQALRLDPNFANAYYGKGNVLWSLTRFDEALIAYEQALRLDPNLAFACYGKGNALRDLKRFDEAFAAYEQALRLNPKLASVYNGKGNALRSLKRFDEAFAAYEQALRLDPNLAFAYNGKGNAFVDLKRFDEALVAYEQALRLDPNLTFAYCGKGNVLWSLKRFDEALAAYEQVLHLDPNLAFAYYGKGNALKALGRNREASKAYQRAKELG